jgi:hypothetical protein
MTELSTPTVDPADDAEWPERETIKAMMAEARRRIACDLDDRDLLALD